MGVETLEKRSRHRSAPKTSPTEGAGEHFERLAPRKVALRRIVPCFDSQARLDSGTPAEILFAHRAWTHVVHPDLDCTLDRLSPRAVRGYVLLAGRA